MSENEIAVGAFSEIADGDYRIFAIDEGTEVGIFRIGDRVVAYENVCPHAGGPVCQGRIFNRVEELLTPDMKSLGLRYSTRRNIVCPWHGYEFDIETGCHPGDRKVQLTPVEVDVRDGQIYVTLRN
jgi:nitrite reductase (NADH) small subunit